MNNLTRFTLFLCLLLLAEKWCDKATDGFTVASLTSAHAPACPTLGSEKAACEILNQSFYYLGSGGQSFAFASADGKYVLKFFNNHPKPWIFSKKYQSKKIGKIKRAFAGYELVFKEIPEESGLVFLHLNKISLGAPKITLIDKLHIAYELDPNDYEFVIQKKAELAQEYVKQHREKAIRAMKELIVLLSQKNIHDEDPSLYRNIGFIEGKAILLDPGRCVTAHGRDAKFPAKFREWIAENFPELTSELSLEPSPKPSIGI